MNFLDLMDPQKRKMMELLQQQQAAQMMQGLTPQMLQQMQGMPQGMPQGMGALKDMPMPMQQGQPGYGVLAPQSNTAANQSAASGAPSMMQALPGLLSMASNLTGGADQQDAPPPPAPPPTGKVGNSKEGLPQDGRSMAPINRKRKFRRQ